MKCFTEKQQKKEAVRRFKERFKDYLKGKDEYIDNIRERWTHLEVIAIYEWAKKLKGCKLK